MDAPAHLFPDRTALDALPASQFCGSALSRGLHGRARGRPHRPGADRAPAGAGGPRGLSAPAHGWDARWATPAYFGEYPVITEEFADYLLATRKRAWAWTSSAIDPIADANLSLHRRLLSQADFVIIENLCNLGACGEGLFSFFALPLKFADSDGARVRALALLPEES